MQKSPPPAWIPDPEFVKQTHIYELMTELKLSSYSDLHRWSVEDRNAFWTKMIARLGISFKKPPTNVLDMAQGAEHPNWLVGAQMNIADSCFQGAPSAPAIVYQKEGQPLRAITYQELHELSCRVANGLLKNGFQPGEAIAIDMAMTVEAVAIYLGIILAGCIAVSIADSFAPDEIKNRLELTNVKGIFTHDHTERAGKQLAMYKKVQEANAPKAIVVPWAEALSTPLRTGDIEWKNFLSEKQTFSSYSATPQQATNYLFSSGTTGEPKVIPWSHTTPIKAAADAYLHHDTHPGDVVAWPTNLGWMMGPWLIYASLINRGCMALYYGAPTGRDFGVFVEQAKVQILGLVPSIVKAWRNSNCMQNINWSALKAFSSTGECSNADDYLFLMSLADYKPVIEYCGGTEIGGAYLTQTLVQPASPSTFSTPALGLDIAILEGELFLIPPSIGLSLELLNKDHHKVYFEGTPKLPDGTLLRRHGDQVEKLPNGYYRAQGRADDTMNLGGIKVSSAEIERILNRVEGVSETAAIAVSPPGGGPSLLVIFAVLGPHEKSDGETLKHLMQKHLREKLNPLFKIEDLVLVPSLPRTASNKVMRRSLRAQYEP